MAMAWTMRRSATAILLSTVFLNVACSDRNATVSGAGGSSGGSPDEGSTSEPEDAESTTSSGGAEEDETSSTSTGPTSRCGDGTVDPGEDCDDGNDIDADGCNLDCTASGSLLWEYELPLGLSGRYMAIGPDDHIHVLAQDGSQLVHVEIEPDGRFTRAFELDVPVELPPGADEVDRYINGFGLSVGGGLVFSLTDAFFGDGELVSAEYHLHSQQPAWSREHTDGGAYYFSIADDGRIVGMRDGFFELSAQGETLATGEYVNARLIAPHATGTVLAGGSLIGFDKDGSIAWTTSWPSGNLRGLTGIDRLPNGDIVAIGEAGENLTVESQLRLARYAPDGSELSEWLWPETPENAGPAYDGLAVTPQGHIAFAGGNNLVLPPDGTPESYLWKLDEDFTERWRVEFPMDLGVRQMRADSTGALVFLSQESVAKFAR
jgi:cysteine-rich repeat protein